MAIPTIQLTGKVLGPDGVAPTAGTITVVLSEPGTAMDGGAAQFVTGRSVWTLAADGSLPAAADLVPNDAITRPGATEAGGTYYTAHYDLTLGGKRTRFEEEWVLASAPSSLDIGDVTRTVAPGTVPAGVSIAALLATKLDVDGNASALRATAAGSTTTRTNAERFADETSVRDHASLSAAIAAAPAGGTVVVPEGTYALGSTPLVISKSLTLRLARGAVITATRTAIDVRASGVTILGGSIQLLTNTTPANEQFGVAMGEDAASTVDDLRIEGVTIFGTGVAADNQTGIGGPSGNALSNIRITRSTVRGLSVGISVNANSSGTLSDVLIDGNRVSDMVGTAAGEGYGIHVANGSGSPSRARISGNYVDGASRHAIYVARGSGVAVCDNAISNHRSTAGSGLQRAAINVARARDVVVSGNVVDSPRDGGIAIVTDATTPAVSVSGITVTDNVIRNWYGWPAITIGSASPGAEGVVESVLVSGNQLLTDADVTGTAIEAIYLHSGKRVTVSDNQIEMLNLGTTANAVRVFGYGETGATADYNEDLRFFSNLAKSTGVGACRFFRLDTLALAMSARMDFSRNRNALTGGMFSAPATITAPNITLTANAADGLVATTIAPTEGVRKVVWRTTAQGSPSSGTWAVGDQAWKTDPSAGTAPGWICTSAGTPGTWTAMASLAS